MIGWTGPGDPDTRQEEAAARAMEQVAAGRKQTEARDRALREARSYVKGILFDIEQANYGLAAMKARHVIAHTEDDQGPCQMVVDALNMLDAGV